MIQKELNLSKIKNQKYRKVPGVDGPRTRLSIMEAIAFNTLLQHKHAPTLVANLRKSIEETARRVSQTQFIDHKELTPNACSDLLRQLQRKLGGSHFRFEGNTKSRTVQFV